MRILPPAPVNLRLEARKRDDMRLHVEHLTYSLLGIYSSFMLTALASLAFFGLHFSILPLIMIVVAAMLLFFGCFFLAIDISVTGGRCSCWYTSQWELYLPQQAVLKEAVKRMGVTPVVLTHPYPLSEPHKAFLRNARSDDNLDQWFTKRSVKNSLLLLKLLHDSKSLQGSKQAQERRRRAEAELAFYKRLGL